MKEIIIGLSCFLIGGLIVAVVKPSEVVEVRREIVKVEINPCDKTSSNTETAMCYAKEACSGKLGNFSFDGWNLSSKFDCK